MTAFGRAVRVTIVMEAGVRKLTRFSRDLLQASSSKEYRLHFLLVSAIILGFASLASAEESRERLQLEYQVAATCPDKQQFISEVHELTDKARFSADSEMPSDRQLRVVIAAGKSGFDGQMSLKDEAGTSLREIEGESCEEVVGALALALALALDPNALAGGEPTDAPGDDVVVLQESPSKDLPKNSGKSAANSAARPRPQDPEPSTHLILGGAFQYGFWLVKTQNNSGELSRASHSRLQGSVSLELETKSLGFWTSYGLAVGAAWAETAPLSFRWLPSVRGFVCPLWLRGNEWLRFGTCVGGIFAPLYSPAGDFEQAQSSTINYAGIDSALRLQFVAGAFRSELQVGIELPLVTRSYATASADGSNNIVLAMDHTPTPTLGLAVGWEIF